ncbi:MAG: COX15/CtaA family protein [Candidatus Nitrospinota bacterium M3_3B_026]
MLRILEISDELMERILVGLSILFTYLLMVMGNVVTTTESGLACPDWPLCYGTVVPPFKTQIWFEWGHRLLGGATGFLILASTAAVWLKKRGAASRWLTTSALGLLAVGVVFGGVIVLIEAPLLQGTLHLAVVSFHIVLATIIFTLMILAFRGLPEPGEPAGRGIYPLLFAVIFAQVFIGILVRYGQASLACPDFPLCQGELLPPLNSFKVMIHMAHRATALAIFLITGWYLVRAVKSGHDVKGASITFGLVIAQGTFGALVVLSGMFLPFIITHGAMGFLLLGWVTYRSAPDFLASRAGPETVGGISV